MKLAFLCFLIAAGAGSMALSQTAASAKTGSTKTSTTKKSTAPVKKATATAGTKKAGPARAGSARKKSAGKKTAVAAVSRQTNPTADRYREIQQALADRGYLKAEPTGVWDDQSADALKQFQTDQHLTPTGKISARSLIDLGLGPKAPSTTAALPGPTALQGSHPPDPADVPSPPETLPAPEN